MQVTKLQAQKKPIELENVTISLLTMDEFKRCIKNIADIHCRWWIRTAGNKYGYLSLSALYSDNNYENALKEIDPQTRCGVRPALHYDKTEAFKLRDRFELGTYVWSVIDNGMALCDGLIAEQPFCWDSNDAETVPYEESDIQRFLTKWLDALVSVYVEAKKQTDMTKSFDHGKSQFVAPFK